MTLEGRRLLGNLYYYEKAYQTALKVFENPHLENDIWATTWQNQQNECAQRRQISLGICPVWSESSLCTQWVATCKDPGFLHADSKDSGLIWVFAGRTCHFVGFVMRQRIYRPYQSWMTIATLPSEPCHEKTCFCHMRTTKAQISLRILAVWSTPLWFAT